MHIDLGGKVVLVTGGAQRVGRSISTAVAAAGADVIVNHWGVGVDAARTAREIEALGRRAVCVEADVSDPRAADALVRRSVEELGRIDVLIHNAGNSVFADFLEVSVEQFDASFDLFVRGPFFLSQSVAKVMLEQGGGKIIAIIGNSYYEAWPQRVGHTVAKSALARLVECMAVALSPTVQCVGVSPAQIMATDSGENLRVQESRGERTEGGTITTRGGTSFLKGSEEDLAELITYLCGSTAYLNGAVIPLDGGKHLF